MGLVLWISHMLLNRPRAFTWYFSKNFHVRNYVVFLFALPLINHDQFSYLFVRLDAWNTVVVFVYLEVIRFAHGRTFTIYWAPGHICPLFSPSFFIVSRPSEQRHHCEKVFFDMHSGRLSIFSISTDDSYLIFGLYFTFVTDFTVNRPVWPSNTLAIKHMDSFGVRKGRLSLNMIESCWHWNQANRYEGLSNNRLINQLIANVR